MAGFLVIIIIVRIIFIIHVLVHHYDHTTTMTIPAIQAILTMTITIMTMTIRIMTMTIRIMIPMATLARASLAASASAAIALCN